MKTLILSSALLLTGFAFGQEEETEKKSSDTTRFTIGDTQFIIVDLDTLPDSKDCDDEENPDCYQKPKRRDLTYWSGIDLGVNTLMDWRKTFNNFNSKHLQMDPASSISFSINFIEQRIRLADDYFGLVTGLGFTHSRYGFKDELLYLNSNADSTFGFIDTTLVSAYKKNVLRVNYFNVPLLLQVNLNKKPKKNFHIAVGAIASVRMSSNVKYEYDSSIGETEYEDRGRFNLSPFQVCATTRIGFRDFGIFANYHFLSLFEKGKSEVAYPLTFGASFHF